MAPMLSIEGRKTQLHIPGDIIVAGNVVYPLQKDSVPEVSRWVGSLFSPGGGNKTHFKVEPDDTGSVYWLDSETGKLQPMTTYYEQKEGEPLAVE